MWMDTAQSPYEAKQLERSKLLLRRENLVLGTELKIQGKSACGGVICTKFCCYMLSMTTYFDSSKSQRWTLYCVTVTMVTYGPRHVAGSWHQMRWDTRKHHLRGVPVRQSVWGVRCHLLVQTGVESSAFRFVHPHSTAQHNMHNTAQHNMHSTTCTTQYRSVWGVRCPLLVQAGV